MKKLILGIVILGLVSLGIVVLNRATPIPFISVVKDADESIFDVQDYGDRVYMHIQPKIMIIGPEISEVEPFIPDAQTVVLDQFATNTNTLLLLILQGAIPQSPHGVDVQRITFKEQQLNVYVLMHTTTTTMISPGGGTSDFEIVAIDRADLPVRDGPITVNMIDQHGDVIATTTFTP